MSLLSRFRVLRSQSAPTSPPAIRVVSVRHRPERLNVLHIPEVLHSDTLAHLREAGRQHREQNAFWGGHITGEGIGVVATLYLPSTFNHARYVTIGDPDVLARMNAEVQRRGEFLLAQVHSHPRDAFHSETDDEGAACGDPGFLSIVVPNYADRDYGPADWAAFEMTPGGWAELPRHERIERLRVLPHRVHVARREET